MSKAKKADIVFDDLMKKVTEIYREEITKGLAYLGNECIKRIREQGRENDWRDQTSNLRSSIGYAIYEYGVKTIASAFEPVTATGAIGHAKGLSYVEELAREFADTYALVVVAGMDYAEHVEKRRDVLASTELWARKRIEEVLKKYIGLAEKRAQTLINNNL